MAEEHGRRTALAPPPGARGVSEPPRTGGDPQEQGGDPAPDAHRLTRLDPDRAAAAARQPAGRDPTRAAGGPSGSEPTALDPSGPEPPLVPPPLEPVIGRGAVATLAPTGAARAAWLIGVLVLAIAIGYAASRLVHHGSGTVGVAAGRSIHSFAAPLATSTLVGDANLKPPCTPAHHDARALNVCLLEHRGPLVLGFFVPGAATCERAIGAMQALSARPAQRGLQFAAVAVHTGRRTAARLVRHRGWTIPVAYDRDGAVGETYGVVVCPLIELVRQGGVVARRLIGDRWATASALAGQLSVLTTAAAAGTGAS